MPLNIDLNQYQKSDKAPFITLFYYTFKHAMKIINFRKKKMKLLLIKEQQELYENAKVCYVCKKMKINM